VVGGCVGAGAGVGGGVGAGVAGLVARVEGGTGATVGFEPGCDDGVTAGGVVSLVDETTVVAEGFDGASEVSVTTVVDTFVGVVVIASRSDFSRALCSPDPQATSTPSEAMVANAMRREETRFISSG